MDSAAPSSNTLIDFVLYLGDTNLILGQRNAEWCAHGPILEQDIAITNISLDLIGQSRNFYQYAAMLINEDGGKNVTEDSLAYLRTEREFKNLLLAELPNHDWAHTVIRQLCFGVYAQKLYRHLLKGPDVQLSAIAEKALKELSYHIRWSSEWVIRLGDGTDESHERMENALRNYWPYTGEMFMLSSYEQPYLSADLNGEIAHAWQAQLQAVLEEATLAVPQNIFMQAGGKQGVHTEHMGFLLTDMQYLQRVYPDAEW